MHHSRLCAVLIDCKTADLDEAARFWAAALGCPVDLGHPMSRDNYRMLETRSDEVLIEIQRVEHESRAHIDIETDDIGAPRKAGRDGGESSGALGRDASTYRSALLCRADTAPWLPHEREPLGLGLTGGGPRAARRTSSP